MPGSNNKALKFVGGISITTIFAIVIFYFTLTDRATSSGEEKATLKKDVEAVSERVDHLETHASETEAVLNGESGLVTSVAVIKNKIENIEKQGAALQEQNKLILRKIDALPKK